MLQVGDIGLSLDEQQSHFSLWAIMASPLLIGSDVSMLTPESLRILGNTEITAINQDSKGVQGVPVNKDSSCWTKPLADGSTAALLLNTGDSTTAVTCTFAQLNVKSSSAKVRDLWAKKDLGTIFNNITATLKSHVAMVVKVTPA